MLGAKHGLVGNAMHIYSGLSASTCHGLPFGSWLFVSFSSASLLSPPSGTGFCQYSLQVITA